MELRAKYELTANSHRNMLSREHSHGAVILPEFREFRGFLICMGPRPSQDHSIDRLDNENPRYGPGLCAWRTKEEQNSNKGDTVFLTDRDGTRLPLAHWAKIKGERPDTMRKRIARGWADHEVIAGHRDQAFSSHRRTADPTEIWPSRDYEIRQTWEEVYQSDAKPGETRNQFLLRIKLTWLHGLGERYEEVAELDDKTLAKYEEALRIIAVCQEREVKEAQKKAEEKVKAERERPPWNDPYDLR